MTQLPQPSDQDTKSLVQNTNNLITVVTNAITQSLEKPNAEKKKPLIDDIKDIITVVTGVASFIIASLWYFGRNYRTGYSSITNVPLEQLNFSIWDYGEDAWVYLGLAIVIGVTVSGLLLLLLRTDVVTRPHLKNNRFKYFILLTAIVVILVVILILLQASTIVNSITLFVCSLVFCFVAILLSLNSEKKDGILRNVFVFAPISLLFIIYLLMVGAFAHARGQTHANTFLRTSIVKVKVTTVNAPISDISSTSTITVGEDLLFQYKDLYLLTYNDKRYYLFDGVDANCRPIMVYLVKEEDVRSVQFLKSIPVNCVQSTSAAAP